MSDLEQMLPPRLRALADDLTPPVDPVGQATAARRRHRQQRRTRIGVTAVAAAVVVIAVGVPTAFSALSAPNGSHVTGPDPATTSATAPADPTAQERAKAQAVARAAAASAAAESAAAAASPGPGHLQIDPSAKTVMDAEVAKGTDELTDALVALRSPVHLGTPPAAAPCPDAAAVLTQGLGTHMAYEQGELDDPRDGCQWSSDGDAAMASQPEVRLTVGVSHRAMPVEQFVSGEQRERAFAQPGQCLTVPDTSVDPRAVLQRCVNGAWVEWYLFLPTADGAGTWMLSVFIGDDLPAPDAGPALTQVAALATATWGG